MTPAGAARRREVPVRQSSLVFEVTRACNHDCPHCYNVWKNPAPYPSGQLSTHQTLQVLTRLLDQTGARHITLTGGEPLLREDLFDIIDFLRARGIAINLITNGTLLDARRLQRLTDNRISVFELPLLSAQREIHDALSGAPGAFDRVTMALADLKSARQRVVCVFVATRLNLPTWRETAELAVALGVDGLMFNRFNPGGRGRDNIDRLQPSPAELTAALDIAETISVNHGLPISCSIAMPPCLFDHSRYPHLGFGFCAAGTDRAYYTVDPLGNIRPCNHSPRILGNILEVDFASMVSGEAMQDFMDARPAWCAGCLHETECQGGCKAAAEACFGCAGAMDPFLSAFREIACKPPAKTQPALPEARDGFRCASR